MSTSATRFRTRSSTRRWNTLEHALHPWVAYAILPLFAFANAGLALGGLQMEDAFAALPLGIALGLVIGKPIGIVGAALLMRALGWARFPAGMDLRAMLGLGAVVRHRFHDEPVHRLAGLSRPAALRGIRARHARRLAVVGHRGLRLAARGAAVAPATDED